MEKKIFIAATLAVAMACAVVSCSKKEALAPQSGDMDQNVLTSGVTMNVVPESEAEVKTSFTDNGDGTYTPKWTVGDAISMSFKASDGSKFLDFNKRLQSSATSETGKTVFSGIIFAPAKNGDYDFFAVYPQSAVREESVPGAVAVTLPSAQYFTPSSFDPEADILFGQKKTISITNAVKDLENVQIRFARINAFARIKVDASASTNPLFEEGGSCPWGQHFQQCRRSLCRSPYRGS